MYAQLIGLNNLCGLQLLHHFRTPEEYKEIHASEQPCWGKVDSLGELPFGGQRHNASHWKLHTGQIITALTADDDDDGPEIHPKSAAVEAIIREKYKIIHESEWLLNYNSGNMFKTIIFEVKAQDGNS